MDIRSKKSSRSFLTAAVLFLLSACAPVPYVFLQYGTELKQLDLAKVVAANPLGPGENIKITTLGQGTGASHHVVQVRDRESPHLHQTHDGTVMLVSGHGYLMMAKKRIELSAGDIVYIPRGIVHYYVNTAPQPSIAFVVFSPPFDGRDNIPAKLP
jgi:mannose-6-phosphate isomerase-like protein (cupin superfamily)